MIYKYAQELIDIIEHPENSNKEWKDMIIENTKDKIRLNQLKQ